MSYPVPRVGVIIFGVTQDDAPARNDLLERLPADWPNRQRSRAVRAGTLHWHVQVAGKGPAILLLHGTGSSAHSWADVLPTLADTATVIAPDLPGHGFTTGAAPDALTLPHIAEALAALMAELRIPHVAVVAGHSAGAAIALQFALAADRRPAAIVGFNPSLVAPPRLYTRVLAPLVTPVATGYAMTSWLALLAKRTGLVAGLLDSTRSAIPAAQRSRYAALFSDRSRVRDVMAFMAATDLPATLAAARALATPMTFVLGSDDAWVRERALRRVIAQAFPRAEILRWTGGHLLHEEAPQRAAALLREILARGR